MFCTKCGTAIRNNYNFCENCGKMLAPCSQSNYRNQTVSPRKDILDSFWFIMNLVGIFIGCIVFFVSLPAIDARDIYYVANGDWSRAGSDFWGALFGVGTMLGCLIDLIIISVRQNIKRR